MPEKREENALDHAAIFHRNRGGKTDTGLLMIEALVIVV